MTAVTYLHIITSFEILWKYLNHNGIYVVEDTQTSYWSKFGGYDKPNQMRATSYFQNLTDGLNYKEFLEKDYKPSDIQKYLDYIHFYHNIIFIGKSLKDKKSLFVENGINSNLIKYFKVIFCYIRLFCLFFLLLSQLSYQKPIFIISIPYGREIDSCYIHT